MPNAVVTGSGGLIGSEAVRQLISDGYEVFGLDNDMRRYFFGREGSTARETDRLVSEFRDLFHWHRADIRDYARVDEIVKYARPDIVVHCAAQPSHDWAAREPLTDFGVNATGTVNLLEATRLHSPDATFIHCSTSKVYGDTPNRLPLRPASRNPVEVDGAARVSRLDLPSDHEYFDGVTTTMSIDGCLHSLFGASKAAGDLVAQEYGRYFGMSTAIFRPGCLTGAGHAGVELHGFLAYLGRCVAQDRPYRIYGYDGLQVRCNIHAYDLVRAFLAYHDGERRPGAVYNIGGGRANACSMLEAVCAFKDRLGRPGWHAEYVPEARTGDHRFWISSNKQFRADHPSWSLTRDLDSIYEEIANAHRL